MTELSWVYPKSIDELVDCLKKDTILHGGGTGIMRNPPEKGLIADLSGVGIDLVTVDGTTAHIGGAATYARTAETLENAVPGNIISRALSDLAAPSLRNRITVGGSIRLFPPWARIVGPLVALEARLRLVGRHEGEYPVADYVNSDDLAGGSAIVEVQAELGDWESHWYRFSPSKINYPLFSVVVLLRSDGNAITDARIVLTGNKGRLKRLESIEQSVRGKTRDSVPVKPADLDTTFPDRQGFSGEYLAHVAAVEITRSLAGGRSAP